MQPQQAPPPYGQPVGDAALGVPQPGAQPAPPPKAPPAKKKSKKPLFGLAGAAAAILVFFLVIFPMIGGRAPGPSDDDLGGGLDIEVFVTPGGRDVPFDIGESNFTTNDPRIKMIEVNQGLSYGFNSDTGDFYLMDNFVAGKETAVFIALTEPLDPKSEIRLKIEKDGIPVATLTSVDFIDDMTLLFQPRDIGEAGSWDQGAYTFTFEMDDSVAVRTTNFYKAMNLKILAIPLVTNYSGDIRKCEGDWKQGATMLSATYPVARDEVEYVLGPEIDLSDPKYDVNTKAGRKEIWQALSAQQTPNNEYTMIIGFIRDKTDDGILGYTYGLPANIVCESEPDMLATIAHEIAHCYKIGDEYENGSLNNILNPPPYKMKGHDILTRDPAEGTKEKVLSGKDFGIRGTGAMIYPEQRPYWLEGREVLDDVSSFMGAGTGAPSFAFWGSSDIYNHIFKVFTGQMKGDEEGYAEPDESSGSEPKGDSWGQCFQCFGDVYDPRGFIECDKCGEYVEIKGAEFTCGNCGTSYKKADLTDDDLWIYHAACDYILYYPKFVEFNSGDGKTTEDSSNLTMVLDIKGDVDDAGTFTPAPWYSYEAPASSVSTVLNGRYSVHVYDEKGDQLAVAYFATETMSEVITSKGYGYAESDTTPVQAIIKFPENAAKVTINDGDKEIYAREVSKGTPTVAITGLTDGQKLSNDVTLTWEASDADAGSGELTYQIWYVRSTLVDFSLMEELFEEAGEEFPIQEDYYTEEEFLLASNVTGTSLKIDLSDYPGTERGWFRILATNGAKTGVATSPFVETPWKAPDILNVLPDVTQVKLTDIIEIIGKVYDAQDGWLWNQGYEWYIDGEFWHNYGDYYFYQWPYTLKPGMHTITLTATNSGGLSASKDFMFEVIEDESDLPDDWSRNDISLALRLGHYLPLNRLDAPVTRIEYVKMMNSLYATAIPDDFDMMPMPEIMCEFNDMSNDYTDMDFAYAYIMVAMGLMGVENMETEEVMGITILRGDFNPGASITEREAMQIFFKTIEIAKEQTVATYEVMDEQEFLPTLEEWGLFDEPGGPNAYQAGDKLTKKKTMSRMARFSKFWYDLDDKFYGWGEGKTDLE